MTGRVEPGGAETAARAGAPGGGAVARRVRAAAGPGGAGVTGRVRAAAARAAGGVRRSGAALPDQLRRAGALLPEAVRPQVAQAIARLREVRSLEDAEDALAESLEQLLEVGVPVLVEHPLPLRARTARLVSGVVGAAAAGLEEAEVLLALFSSGTLAAPGLPAVLAAEFAALVGEVYVATSVRVRRLEEAGVPVDAQAVAADVAQAMAGSRARLARREVTRVVVRRIVRRLSTRWAAAAVPVAGMVYGGWSAQATIRAIDRMPVRAGGS